MRVRPDARQQQKLRRPDRPAAQNRLLARFGDLVLPVLSEGNAGRALALEQHLLRMGVGDDP